MSLCNFPSEEGAVFSFCPPELNSCHPKHVRLQAHTLNQQSCRYGIQGTLKSQKWWFFLQSPRDIGILRYHPSVRHGGWAATIIIVLSFNFHTNSPKPLWSGGNMRQTHCLLMQSQLGLLPYSVPNYKPYLTGAWDGSIVSETSW